MAKREWSIGVCRESDAHPWGFYMDAGGDDCGVFEPTKDGLIQALSWCGKDQSALMEVWETWNEALRINAPD